MSRPAMSIPSNGTWMKRYRVWEANREVFLWPENWLYPQLRDDQSPIFQQVMSSLLQSDITDDAAAEAYLDYLSNLADVAKLEPCGIFYVPATAGCRRGRLSRRPQLWGASQLLFPPASGGAWSPWAEVQIDCEDMPVTPIVWNGRLLLFWLKVHKDSVSSSSTPASSPGRNAASAAASSGSITPPRPPARQFGCGRHPGRNHPGHLVVERISTMANGSRPNPPTPTGRPPSASMTPSGARPLTPYRDQVRTRPGQLHRPLPRLPT